MKTWSKDFENCHGVIISWYMPDIKVSQDSDTFCVKVFTNGTHVH
jgi:hypothetical protein